MISGRSGFSNPYAKAKAIAVYEIAKQVSAITIEACFKIHELDLYIPLVAAAHEIMRNAARLANEAREMEKENEWFCVKKASLQRWLS